MLRMTAIVAALVACAATTNIATARDNCGSGWYWNGYRCAPSRSEERLRTEERFRDDRRYDRFYGTTGYSERYRSRCSDGYRWIDGRCSWIGRDRF